MQRGWGGGGGEGVRQKNVHPFEFCSKTMLSPSRILLKVLLISWISNPCAINTFYYFRLWPLFSSLSRKCTDPRRSCNGFSWPTFCVGWPWCRTTCSALTTWRPSSTVARPRQNEEAWKTSGSMKESGWGRSVFYFTVQQVCWNRIVWLNCHHFEAENFRCGAEKVCGECKNIGRTSDQKIDKKTVWLAFSSKFENMQASP